MKTLSSRVVLTAASCAILCACATTDRGYPFPDNIYDETCTSTQIEFAAPADDAGESEDASVRVLAVDRYIKPEDAVQEVGSPEGLKVNTTVVYSVASKTPLILACPGPTTMPRPPVVRPPVLDTPRAPIRRPVRPGQPYVDVEPIDPRDLSLGQLCDRLRREEERKRREREIECLESPGKGAWPAPWEADFYIDNWRQLNPADQTYTSRKGCRIEHRARWEEGGTNPTQPWQKYQTNVTGQIGAYKVTAPSGDFASFDGIRVIGPTIVLGIETKGRIDPTDNNIPDKTTVDWEDQAERQVRVAQQCEFATVWILGNQRAYDTMALRLLKAGVNEVYFSLATPQGGGNLYETLRAQRLRAQLGPSIQPPP